jgi:hypothetical protein
MQILRAHAYWAENEVYSSCCYVTGSVDGLWAIRSHHKTEARSKKAPMPSR